MQYFLTHYLHEFEIESLYIENIYQAYDNELFECIITRDPYLKKLGVGITPIPTPTSEIPNLISGQMPNTLKF
jgi:hypothetical protein